MSEATLDGEPVVEKKEKKAWWVRDRKLVPLGKWDLLLFRIYNVTYLILAMIMVVYGVSTLKIVQELPEGDTKTHLLVISIGVLMMAAGLMRRPLVVIMKEEDD
jgi:hypothetical protein